VAERIEKVGKSVIVYDDTLLDHIDESLFELSTWRDAPAAPGYSGGRGKTLYVDYQQQNWVLRHYHRGGAVGRLLNDEFFYTGTVRSRSFLEWRLLDRLYAASLPVPRPVAARIVRRGLIYSADLMSVCIPDVEPFSTRLMRAPVERSVWREIGHTLARFHQARVYHADLTAHNIQIDKRDKIFLLDFDRGRIMPGRGSWSSRNLSRLHRSLNKIGADGDIEFTVQHWTFLLEGYLGTYGSSNS
jgi:3-deoxy-D-manno-octulosonic acid kinase